MILITKSNIAEFENLKNNDIPLLVDFFAEWCGPCRMLAPVIEEVSFELNGKVTFVKIDIDEMPELATSLNIRSIPTLVVFQKNRELGRQSGFMNGSQIKDFLKSLSVKI